MSGTDPEDDDMDMTQEALIEKYFGVLADGGDDADEGGAASRVANPHKPSPLHSAVALPLPVEDDSD